MTEQLHNAPPPEEAPGRRITAASPDRRLLVVALGGNALLRRGQELTEKNQRENVRLAVRALAPLARHDLVITHGNGPQVGLLALEAACYTAVEPYALDVLGSESEGMIGYSLSRSWVTCYRRSGASPRC